MTIIVIAVAIVFLVFLIWIICACVVMSRHPHTKFGQALFCQTG